MKNDIKFEGVNFNREFVSSHKSEKEFLEAMSDKTYSHLFAGDNREAKLKELYKTVSAKAEPVKEAASKEAPKP
jgi:hypothetical protein